MVLELAAPYLMGTLPSAIAFRALLQIRAVRKKPGALSPVSFSPVLAQSMDHDEHSVSASFFFVEGCAAESGGGLQEAPDHLQRPSGVQMPSGLTFVLVASGSQWGLAGQGL